MNTKTPTPSTQVVLRWKVLYQTLTTNSVIYYTTDGTTPSGSYGIGTGTTQVANGTYACIFSSPRIDVVTAVIPAQSLGTNVKYIIGAWNNAYGEEVFANGNGTSCVCGNVVNNASQATVFSYSVD